MHERNCYIIIGVSDDGEIIGLSDENRIKQVVNTRFTFQYSFCR
ncbi:hypothetical protein [Salibacterium aidingense]